MSTATSVARLALEELRVVLALVRDAAAWIGECLDDVIQRMKATVLGLLRRPAESVDAVNAVEPTPTRIEPVVADAVDDASDAPKARAPRAPAPVEVCMTRSMYFDSLYYRHTDCSLFLL